MVQRSNSHMLDSGALPTHTATLWQRHRSHRVVPTQFQSLAATLFLVILWQLYVIQHSSRLEHYELAPILVSYSYFEKDIIQMHNMEYILAMGRRPSPSGQPIHWVFVVSTDTCSPCGFGFPGSTALPADRDAGIKRISQSEGSTLIYRTENIGMDIGSHNITLTYLAQRKKLSYYKFFIFLNSSVKGPFFPTYMPKHWHWTHAFLAPLHGEVHAVGASLVCLPPQDAGGPGARLESWAFALDTLGLEAAVGHGAFHIRACKTCTNKSGIVVGGEYGITKGLFERGYNIATLMSKYGPDVDWRSSRNWHCNDNVHPSRHGTYDGIAFHPFETLFVKSSWHVGDPYTQRYALWESMHQEGDAGTDGVFNQDLYLYAISAEAQEPNFLEMAYNVTLMRQQSNVHS